MTPAKIKRYAELHGVQFNVEGSEKEGGYSIDCWSPKGKRFMCSGTHFLSLPGDGYYTKPDWNQTMAALKEAIEFGVEDCDEKDCEVCE